MKSSWLPPAKQNLFQAIRAKRTEVREQGMKLLDLSIGEPRGPALLSARQAAATAIMSDKEEMHQYQYNASPGVPGFAKMFVEFCTGGNIQSEAVEFLPISGIKRMLGLAPLACGCWRVPLTVATMTEPGYPFPTDWCDYLQVNQYALPLNQKNTFRFQPEDISEETRLLMLNYPHNPTGRVVDREWWEELCEYCSSHGIRIFNDAAYATLAYTAESCTLAEVATGFPDLSWIEAFSASKVIGNGTGWQIGAMVGSADFIGDIGSVKGNTDEGLVAAMATGVASACRDDQEGITFYREMYRSRLLLFIDLLKKHGMDIAVEPNAGFFTLWRVPDQAFGEEIRSAEHFNFLMMERTGLIGVHFEPHYIRYAVCADVDALAESISDAFVEAKVSYR